MIVITITSVITAICCLIYATGLKIEKKSIEWKLINTTSLLELKENQYDEMKAFAGESVAKLKEIGEKL